MSEHTIAGEGLTEEPGGGATERDPERLHPAEHRAYRELYASSRQLVNRWGRLSAALEDTPIADTLGRAAGRVEDLLEALPEETARYGVSGGPAAQGVGARLGDLRAGLLDRSVDTGMVLRLAVLDIEHTATLLSHLAELARARGDDDLEAFCRKWRGTHPPPGEGGAHGGDRPRRRSRPRRRAHSTTRPSARSSTAPAGRLGPSASGSIAQVSGRVPGSND